MPFRSYAKEPDWKKLEVIFCWLLTGWIQNQDNDLWNLLCLCLRQRQNSRLRNLYHSPICLKNQNQSRGRHYDFPDFLWRRLYQKNFFISVPIWKIIETLQHLNECAFAKTPWSNQNRIWRGIVSSSFMNELFSTNTLPFFFENFHKRPFRTDFS